MEVNLDEFRLLVKRVARLERNNRWLWLLAGICITVLTSLATMGAMSSPASPNRQPPIVLTDERGTIRAALGFEDAMPGLRFYDQSGRKRLAIDLWPNGAPHVDLLHENGTVQAELSLANGDLPWLELRDKGGKELVNVGINSYGSPSLEMSNGAYTHHLALTFFKDNFPKLALYGPDFDDRGIFGLGNAGFARLALFGPKETERGVFQMSPTGVPNLFLRGESDEILFEAPTKVSK